MRLAIAIWKECFDLPSFGLAQLLGRGLAPLASPDPLLPFSF